MPAAARTGGPPFPPAPRRSPGSATAPRKGTTRSCGSGWSPTGRRSWSRSCCRDVKGCHIEVRVDDAAGLLDAGTDRYAVATGQWKRDDPRADASSMPEPRGGRSPHRAVAALLAMTAGSRSCRAMRTRRRASWTPFSRATRRRGDHEATPATSPCRAQSLTGPFRQAILFLPPLGRQFDRAPLGPFLFGGACHRSARPMPGSSTLAF